MKQLFSTIILGFVVILCSAHKGEETKKEVQNQIKTISMETITLGAGCFWCVEAIFQDIKGVQSVVSGYANGAVQNPTYKEVCSGTTGHAEVVQIIYDPEIVSFSKILEVFWQTHDPTTLNRQGADTGTQYRSGIYYHNEVQKEIARDIFNKLDDAGAFINPIVTEIEAIESFYPAENYHQDYFDLNGENPYCKAIVSPKVEKFKKTFSDILK